MAMKTINCRGTHFYGINDPAPKSGSFYMKTDRLREIYGPFLEAFAYFSICCCGPTPKLADPKTRPDPKTLGPTPKLKTVVIVKYQVEKAESKDIDRMLAELETLSDAEARRVFGDESDLSQ